VIVENRVLTEDDFLHFISGSRTQWKTDFSTTVAGLSGDWKTERGKDTKELSLKLYGKMYLEKVPKVQDGEQPKRKRRKRLGGKNQASK